jgi:hypothetical protein
MQMPQHIQQHVDPRMAQLFQIMWQKHAEEEAAAAQRRQQEEIDASCKIAVLRETKDMRQQIGKLEEQVEHLATMLLEQLKETQQLKEKQQGKKKKKPNLDEDASEEEEAEEPKTVKKKRGRPKKTDKKQ